MPRVNLHLIFLSLLGLSAFFTFKYNKKIIIWTSVMDAADNFLIQVKISNQSVFKKITINEEKKKVVTKPQNQTCVRPDLDIKEEAMASFFAHTPQIQCDSESDWICIENGNVYICNDTRVNHKNVECTLIFLKRQSDHLVLDDDHVEVSGSDSVKLKSDFFRVQCDDGDGITWKNIMAGIARKSFTEKEKSSKEDLGLDVFIWGHDSLSRLAFMRKMPKTYEYLTEILDAVVLKGYNIVGDGTPQALIPILTGKTELELPETRKRLRAKANFVDVYPFIWKDFKKSGYVTAYAEDLPFFGTFTYRLMGFKNQPTDHYMRTFFLSVEQDPIQHLKSCLRATPRHKVAMNWFRQFFTTYVDKPKFAFSFLSELSHSDYNQINSADVDLREMIYFLDSRKYLNKTLLILMSDHGHRFAQIRETQVGKQEERLPFFALVFPKWFEKKYPEAVKNLRINSNRLTTPFDIYSTLSDVLHFNGSGKGSVKNRGISLFKEVPLERSCKDAFIEPHWCTCLKWESVSKKKKIVKSAANFIVDYINRMTIVQRDFCHVLKLSKIILAGKYVPEKSLLKFKENADEDGTVPDMSDKMEVGIEFYQIKLQTKPGGGRFEASVKYYVAKNDFTLKLSDISRVNKYGIEGDCVSERNEELRKFCYCKLKRW